MESASYSQACKSYATVRLSGSSSTPNHATAVIDYKAADGDGSCNGTILYIKPALHWTEPAGIVRYARAHETFPHETTTDQWFTESQFESYRSLGFETAKDILDRKDIPLPGETEMTLRRLLANLPETTRAAESAGSLTPEAQPAMLRDVVHS